MAAARLPWPNLHRKQKKKKSNISAVHQKAAIVLRNHRGAIQLIKNESGSVCPSTSIREAMTPLFPSAAKSIRFQETGGGVLLLKKDYNIPKYERDLSEIRKMI